jgi:Flp pilus assembly pilin Flp
MSNFLSKKKGQSTAEYAILVALVVAAAVAMQTYLKRNLQGGMKFVVDQSTKTTKQYEPYYLESSYNTTIGAYTDTEETKQGGEVDRVIGSKAITRSGSQTIKDTTTAD